MRKTIIRMTLLLILSTTGLYPEEGFWPLHYIPKLNLHTKGYEISYKDIFHPSLPSLNESIVSLNKGEGSGAFVSKDGLILTNLHVVQPVLQRVSSPENNYYKNGYLARSREKEIQAVGFDATIILNYRDVTSEVEEAVKNISSSAERMRMLRKIAKKFIDQLKSEEEQDIQASGSMTHRGTQWYVLRYITLRDIRVVYVPPLAVGRFGGEAENWQWPSHAGDFAFLRAYISADGKKAEYSKDNVPFQPRLHIKVSLDGLSKGDPVFILGFPGNSMRHRTSFEIDYQQNLNLPWEIKSFQQKLDIVDKYFKNKPDIRLKLVDERQGLSSRLKNRKGTLEGLIKSKLLQKKRDQEENLQNFILSDESLRNTYGNIIERIGELYKQNNQTAQKEFALAKFIMFCDVFNIARDIGQLSLHNVRSKKAVEQLRNRTQMRFYSLYLPVDKEMFKIALKEALLLPKGQMLETISHHFEGIDEMEQDAAVDNFVEHLYKNTHLTDMEKTLALIGKSKNELLALNDPFFEFVADLAPDLEWFHQWHGEFSGEVGKIRSQYIELLKLWKGELFYPESDSTIRFSYGTVQGFTPKEAVFYAPFTTLRGLMEKETGKEPFYVLPRLKEIYRQRDFGQYLEPRLNNEIPVAFLSDLDIIGGNSGSPVLDANGNLVGIVYDRNYEAMIAEYAFLPEVNRTIAVDIRYVLFLLHKFAGANSLLHELGIAE